MTTIDPKSPAKFTAAFRCFRGCAGTHPLTRPVYRCPTCDGLLEVAHDMAALATVPADTWKKTFDGRRASNAFPDTSGVWSKREWVAPELATAHVVSTDEGRTSLFRATRFGASIDVPNLAIKQCGNSHSGSFKDLGMTVLVSTVRKALAEGALASPVIACASTGDTSASLAAYGALVGLPVVVLLPKGLVSTAQLVQPLAHGATVLALETDFDGCMVVVRELAKRGLIYLANSMNPLRIEGQKTVALEIAEQMGWDVPEWVVIPSGNLGNAAALHAGFRMMKELGVVSRLPRLLVAQAENANPMYRAFKEGKDTVAPVRADKSLASAIQIGNPVSAPRAMVALRAMEGVVEQASENELADAAARADRAGLYACPHTAVALAATEKQRKAGVIRKDDRVVVVSTANGLKFTEFKLGYHERTLSGIHARHANVPVTLPPDVDAVAAAISKVASARG
ncbi:MAG: threonine synthase [Polyangiaceae bacterium]